METPLMALFAVVFGGVGLKMIDYWLIEQKRKSVDNPVVDLDEHLTEEDKHWKNKMLAEAGILVTGVNTCGCGYTEGCYVHCNHNLDDCPGEAYAKPPKYRNDLPPTFQISNSFFEKRYAHYEWKEENGELTAEDKQRWAILQDIQHKQTKKRGQVNTLGYL